jgi:hypothetical protein
VEAQNFLKGFIDQECVGEYPADVVHELRACYHLADPYSGTFGLAGSHALESTLSLLPNEQDASETPHLLAVFVLCQKHGKFIIDAAQRALEQLRIHACCKGGARALTRQLQNAQVDAVVNLSAKIYNLEPELFANMQQDEPTIMAELFQANAVAVKKATQAVLQKWLLCMNTVAMVLGKSDGPTLPDEKAITQAGCCALLGQIDPLLQLRCFREAADERVELAGLVQCKDAL